MVPRTMEGLSSWKTPCLFLALLTFLSSCSREKTEEEVLRGVVYGAAKSAEAKDVLGFMGFVSKDYLDDEGNNYEGVKGIVFYNFMRSEKITVLVRSVEVEVKGERGLVDSRVVLVRGKEVKAISDVVPEEAQAFRFEVVFSRSDGEWKAISARWEELGVAGLL